MSLCPLSVLISVPPTPTFFLPNAFSCLFMVWAASLMKVSSYFLIQLPLQLIYLSIFVFSSALNGFWKVEKKIQSTFWGALDSWINAGMYICIFKRKTKRKIASIKNNETDLKLIGLSVLYPFIFQYRYFNFCSFQMLPVLLWRFFF